MLLIFELIGVNWSLGTQFDAERIQALHKLGLTTQEAKIYLICLKSGRQKINSISFLTNIDRANTYHAIKKLQELGLINELLGKPNLYEALPAKEGVSILLQSKEEEFLSVKKEARKLSLVSSSEKPEYMRNYEFKIVRQPRTLLEQTVIDYSRSAQISFDVLSSERLFSCAFINLAAYQMNCMKRGVEGRYITEQANIEKYQSQISPFLENPHFRIRGTTETPRAEFIIKERKSLAVLLNPYEPFGNAHQLITDHPLFVEIFQNYFDKLWNEAQECK